MRWVESLNIRGGDFEHEVVGSLNMVGGEFEHEGWGVWI